MERINKPLEGKIFGYARVSTREQNLNMQLDVLQQQECVKIFCEKISGIKKRPELERCLSVLQAGDVLVVYKLDRLARSLSEIVRICSDLESKKIRIKSVKDNIDTTDYMGKFTMHIFAALAEFERNVILERTREGREAAQKRGKVFGRPKGLSELAQEKVKTAAILYQRGDSIKMICRKIEVKSKSTLYKYLQLSHIPLRAVLKD
ncbi:MAG: recombinase family protein [Odoribacter sp.]